MISTESLSPATNDTPHRFLARSAAVGSCSLTPHPWPLARGGFLNDPVVHWEVVGRPRAPVIAVLGGISAGRHVTANHDDVSVGWWNRLVGPSRAIDTDRFRVLGVEYLATSAESEDANEQPPVVDTHDQARALLAALQAIGETRFHAVIGSSYGGMVALALAAQFRASVKQIVVVSAAHRAHPQSTAWRSVQRRIVRFGSRTGATREAMEISRSLAMVTYRSPTELRNRFSGDPVWPTGDVRRRAECRFPVEGYLRSRGRDFARTFSAERFLTLSESIDLHRVDPRSIDVPTTLVAVSSDQLIPVIDMENLARELSGPCSLVEIESIYGHDAFLKETDKLDRILRQSLGEEVTA